MKTKKLTIDVGCTPFVPAEERTYPTCNFVDEENWLESEYIMLTPEELSEIVIPEQTIVVLFSYPLDGTFPFVFKTTKKEGFTRKRLIDLISNKYLKIYEVDDRESNLQGGGRTYGIWGHDIEDLVLSSVESTKVLGKQPEHIQKLLSIRGARFATPNTPVFTLGVDS